MNLECSSRGDKRFSAFYAMVEVNGKLDSIENHYQLCKRVEGLPAPSNWREVKGRKVDFIVINNNKYKPYALTPFYKLLWVKYLINNPALLDVINKYDTFSDMFKGKSINCQAYVMAEIKDLGIRKVFDSNMELLNSYKD